MDSESISYLKTNYEGCGHSKAEALLRVFGSIENIENESFERLVEVDGVGRKLAKRIMSNETKVPHHFDYPRPDGLDTQSLRQELSELMEAGSNDEIILLLKRVVKQTCLEGKIQAQIGVLIHVFGRTPDAKLIAKAASDTTPIYVRRFVWDEEEGQVVLQNNAAKRRIEQADMMRRKRVLETYNACVGCGGFKNRVYQCETHHITPIDGDGSAEDSNIVPVCPECHSELHRTGDHGGVIYASQDDFWEWAELEPRLNQ